MPDPGHVTRILSASRTGDPRAQDQLLELVYDELRSLAGAFLQRERQDHTLQPTALVHEAWLRMVGQMDARIQDRNHFVSVAASVIRRILIDHARRKKSLKRGGGQAAEEWEAALTLAEEANGLDLLALDEALDRLESLSLRQRRIVELRYFGGLSIQEAAGVLEVSPATVKAEWAMARAWLRQQLDSG